MLLALLVTLSLLISVTSLVIAVRELWTLVGENRSLRERADRAERNLRHLGDLANEVAHEIKNPLTAILCSAETLEIVLKDQVDETHRTSLRYMKEYGEHLLRIVGDFLDFSQAETERLHVRSERVSLRQSIDSVIGLLNAQAMQKGVTVKVSGDEDLCIYFAPKHLAQILFNLLHNAIKFTPRGGEILIQATKDHSTQEVTLSVSDTGVGIAEERLQEIFEPYRTTLGSESDEQQVYGTGLGLALCRSLVRCHGGELGVKSALGVGTTFTFSAPLWNDQGKEVRVETTADQENGADLPAPHTPLQGQRFLVVEPEGGISHTVTPLIEAWGGIVDAAHQVEAVLTALREHDYDAVMVDGSAAGGISPEEVTQLVNTHRRSEETSIILTARREQLEVDLPLPVDGTLEKPYSGTTLLRSLLQTGKYSVTH
ncbi:hybrid sensor histidine kinase/response regulator [bacterium]|nr:hybrid sensor histidine kinase/response regulator [bacterium]